MANRLFVCDAFCSPIFVAVVVVKWSNRKVGARKLAVEAGSSNSPNKHTSSGKNMGIINLPLRNYPTRLERKLVMKHLLTTLIHGETWKLSQMFLAKDQIPEVWSN